MGIKDLRKEHLVIGGIAYIGELLIVALIGPQLGNGAQWWALLLTVVGFHVFYTVTTSAEETSKHIQHKLDSIIEDVPRRIQEQVEGSRGWIEKKYQEDLRLKVIDQQQVIERREVLAAEARISANVESTKKSFEACVGVVRIEGEQTRKELQRLRHQNATLVQEFKKLGFQIEYLNDHADIKKIPPIS